MAKQWTIEELREAKVALDELQVGIVEKHDVNTTTVTGVGPHGFGGLFSTAGIRPDVYSTVPRPINDFNEFIPMQESRLINERYEILTGVTATEGNAAADACQTPPKPGQLKKCAQSIPFGKMFFGTRTIDLSELGMRVNYADLDRRFLNLGTNFGRMIPQPPGVGLDINTYGGKAFVEAGLGAELSLSLVGAQGVAGATSNANYYNLWIKQFRGLEGWIRTGYTDVDSQSAVLCPAADSMLFTHNALITASGTNGFTFVENLVNAIYSVRETARKVGMQDTVWAVVVHRKLWRAIAYQWACTYYTTGCTGSAGNPVWQNAPEIVRARDEMMLNHVLMVDGEPVMVLIDDGIQIDGTANNTFNSDVLIVPLNWRGTPLTYWQNWPAGNIDVMEFQKVLPVGDVQVLNNGLYLMTSQRTQFCIQASFVAKLRLIMDTPFLAAKITDVQFVYAAQDKDAFVGASSYRNGGVSSTFSA